MVAEDYENEEVQEEAPEEEGGEELSREEILEEYRRRQMIEHLTGPLISFFIHLILIALAAFFFVGEKITESTEIEFESKEMEVTELEPPELEKIEEIEEEVPDKKVPKVDKPDAKPEKVDKAQTEQFKEAMASADTSMEFQNVTELRSISSPVSLPSSYGGRTDKGREKALDKYAGGKGGDTEKAVLLALDWLKETQKPDGSWPGKAAKNSNKNRIPITGLGLLAFLAHGETPASSDKYGETVKKAMQFLIDYFHNHEVLNNEYKNGIIAYALAEAYALTGLPSVKGVAKRCVREIIDGQQLGGGWSYNYEKGDFYVVALSGWQMQALKASYDGGMELDGLVDAIDEAINFMNKDAYKNGGFPQVGAYSQPNRGKPQVKYTAMGTLALQLLGERKAESVKESLELLEERVEPEWPEKTAIDLCYKWYYINQCFFQGGMHYFRSWNNDFAPVLVENQEEDGYWDMPPDSMGELHFKHWYWTALNTLSLEVYYRYLPSYSTPEKVAGKEEDLLDTEEVESDDLGLQLDSGGENTENNEENEENPL